MSYAIELTEANLDKIADETNKPLREVRDWLIEANSLNEKRVIVFDTYVGSTYWPWVNFNEIEFHEFYDWIDKSRTNKICKA